MIEKNNLIINDALKITKILNKHADEDSCPHSFTEIIKEIFKID
jgi:hypothetical protein